MVSLFMATDNTNRDGENFYYNLFQSFDIPKECFYFSYTYDLTHSLQENIMRKVGNRLATMRSSLDKQVDQLDSSEALHRPWESAFMWNRYHVEEFYSLIDCKLWVIPFIHGFVSQVNFRSIGKRMSLILVSRRSRFFAGTRYLKRGINEAGFCANYVETE